MATGTYANFSDFNFTDYPINDNVRCTNYVVSKGTVLSATNCSATGFAKEYYYVQGENAKAYGENTEDNGNENVVTTLYANGDVVYFNPETGMKCNESEAVSTTGTRGGCMKWYTFNDSEGATSVNMILDHNTTSTCTFEGLVSHLIGDTTTWKSNLNARNITANEVAQIVGHPTWNSNTAGTSNWFYLDSLDQTQTKNASNPSSYAWLFNNLYQSKTYGGTLEDNNTYNYSYYNSTTSGSTAVATTNAYGYWTANDVATDSAFAWRVNREGYLGNVHVSYAYFHGVRPVITVSKNIIK